MSDAHSTAWVLCPSSAVDTPGLVHPDDVEKLRTLSPYCKVFEVVGHEDGFDVLNYTDEHYRVKPAILKPVTPSSFRFGENVIVKAKAAPAVIREIIWHYKESKPFYFLEIYGKQHSKRFWAEELMKD